MAEINLNIGANLQDITDGLKKLQQSFAEFQDKAKAGFGDVEAAGDKAFKDLKSNIDKTLSPDAFKAFANEAVKSNDVLTEAINDSTDAERKRLKILNEEIQDLAELKQRSKAAYDPSEIKAYNTRIKETETRIKSLGGGYSLLKDISKLSLGEMRKYLFELRNMNISAFSDEQLKEYKRALFEVTDAHADLKKATRVNSDTTQSLIGAFSGVIAAAQGVTGSLALFGIENKNLEKSMLALINLSQAMETFHRLNEEGTIKDTYAKIKNTVATWANNKAQTSGTKVASGFFKVIAANPMLALAAGVAAVGVGLYLLINRMNKVNETQKLFNEANKKAAENMASERVELDQLTLKLADAIRGRKDVNKLVAEYNTKFKQYGANLKTENLTLKELANSYTSVTNAMITRFKIQAYEEQLVELYKKQATLEMQRAERQNELNEAYGENLNLLEATNYVIGGGAFIDAYKDLDGELNKVQNQIYAFNRNLIQQNNLLPTTTQEVTEYGEAIKRTAKGMGDLRLMTLKGYETFEEAEDVVQNFADELTGIATTDNLKTAFDNGDELAQAVVSGMMKSESGLKELYDRRIITHEAYIESLSKVNEKKIPTMLDQVNSMLEKYGISPISQGQLDQIKDVVGKSIDIFNNALERQIQGYDQLIAQRNQKIGELQSLLTAEIQLNEQGYASNISGLEDQIRREQQLRDDAIAKREQALKRQQFIERVTQSINLASSIAQLIKGAVTQTGGNPILAPILAAAGIAAILALFKQQKAASNAATFAKGGSGVLGGRRHSQGGTNLGEIGEGEQGEAWYILSRQATSKNKSLMDAAFEFANGNNKISLPNVSEHGGGTLELELKEHGEIVNIWNHLKKNKTIISGNGYREERFGNVTRRIKA